MTTVADDAFGLAMEQVERLIDLLERQSDSQAVQQARELLHAVLELHAIGLELIWQQLCSQRGELAASLSGDPRIAALLSLHAIEPQAPPSGLIPATSLLRPNRTGAA